VDSVRKSPEADWAHAAPVEAAAAC
jgi:hypothetical protein